MAKKKKQIPVKVSHAESHIKDFFDMVAPATVKFNADHFVFGDTYRAVWAVREYPPQTKDQAILCHLGDRENVTLHIYARYVDEMEQKKIFQNAQRKNNMLSASQDLQEAVNAEGNLQDVASLLAEIRTNKEPLIHCAVFIEFRASSLEKLEELQTEVSMELIRERIAVDRLTMRQNKDWGEDTKEIHGVAPIRAEADDTEAICKLCREYISMAKYEKKPPQLLTKVNAVASSIQFKIPTVNEKQIDTFIVLLLLLSMDEYRKCLQDGSWEELYRKLTGMYVSYADNGNTEMRLRQICSDVREMNQVYDIPSMFNDADIFVKPILKVAMDCIRLIHHLEGRERNAIGSKS